MFRIAVWWTRSCIRPQILWSTGLRSGEFAGQSSSPMKLGVSRRSNAMVSFARCAGALACWKMKKSPDIHPPDRWQHLLHQQHIPVIFAVDFHPMLQVPRSINVLWCAHRTWSSDAGLTIHAGGFSNLSQQYIGAIFSNPPAEMTTVTLQQY